MHSFSSTTGVMRLRSAARSVAMFEGAACAEPPPTGRTYAADVLRRSLFVSIVGETGSSRWVPV